MGVGPSPGDHGPLLHLGHRWHEGLAGDFRDLEGHDYAGALRREARGAFWDLFAGDRPATVERLIEESAWVPTDAEAEGADR